MWTLLIFCDRLVNCCLRKWERFYIETVYQISRFRKISFNYTYLLQVIEYTVMKTQAAESAGCKKAPHLKIWMVEIPAVEVRGIEMEKEENYTILKHPSLKQLF